MNINFRRSITANFMVFENTNNFSEHSFEAMILGNNDIKNLLGFSYEAVDGQTNLLFDISGMQSFSKIYEVERMSYREIYKLIMSVRETVEVLGEYLLDVNNIVLKKECIFIDSETEEYHFCYHPCYNGDIETEMRELLEFLLSVVDYDDSSAVEAAYDLLGIAQNDNFIMEDLANSVRRLNKGGGSKENIQFENAELQEEKQAEKDYSFEGLGESIPDPFSEKSAEKSRGFFSNFRKYLKGRTLTDLVEDIDNGEFLSKVRESGKFSLNLNELADYPRRENVSESSEMIDGYGDNVTTILTPDMLADKKLVGINRRQGQVIQLDLFPFTLGKNPEQSDLVLDDPAISRIHARLYHEDGNYYIEDLNSKNGTYINEKEVESYTRYSLIPGDVIRLAREEFCFR